MDADLLFRPVDELAGLVRSGEVSARELTQLSLDRIEALNPRFNAFVDVFAERALHDAGQVQPGDERPLAGVPVAIKDNRALEGERMTFAAEFMGEFQAPLDDNVVSRLKAAGAIVVGKTALPPEEPPGVRSGSHGLRVGPNRAVSVTGRMPHSGSAAAVAAGMVPFAHANDGGGSTRIPAACCGLVGLKPQRGRISLAPTVGELFLVQDGVLTRTVRETAAILDLLAGPVLGDSSWAPPPAEPFAQTASREPGKLRIALTSTVPIPDVEADPEHVAALHRTGELLESLGHEVEEVEAPWGGDLLETFTASFGPAVTSQIAFAALVNGREPTEADMEPLSWWLWQTCKQIDSIAAQLAALQLQGAARAAVSWISQWDVVVTPGLAEAPVPLGTIDPMQPDAAATFRRSGAFTPYTALFNVTGQPAMNVPLHQREDGLPLGIQLVGQPAEEGALLALAAQLEQAAPWAERRAPV